MGRPKRKEDSYNETGSNNWAEAEDEYGPLTDEDAVYRSVKKKEDEKINQKKDNDNGRDEHAPKKR